MTAEKVCIGIVGFGEFSKTFLSIWLAHPGVGRVAGCELIEERRLAIEEKYHIPMYRSYEEMLEREPGLNSVAIFAQRHQHGPMAIQGLKAGKHVFSAVPMGCSEEELREILALAQEKRLIYMMGETCYYFPCAIWCREKYKKGDFGKFVYGESQYYHDIADMFASFAAQGDAWKRVAGIPPMFYATHSISMLFSAINQLPTEVSCFGYKDTQGDGIYGKGMNDWDNPYSNETAIFRTSGGGIARINEFRRCGNARPTSYITGLYGDTGAYEGSGNQHLFSRNDAYQNVFSSVDVSDEINTFNFLKDKDVLTDGEGRTDYWYMMGFSKVHNLNRLPKNLAEMDMYVEDECVMGHNGAHVFLVDDFVRSVTAGKLPPLDPWTAATYTVAGIKAHESAMLGGRTLPIPDMGKAPEDWETISLED